MILNTHPNDRKEMVRAISELTGLEASYLYMPTCAYQIGPVIVNRNESISCDDEAVVETILPMLRERGWLNAEQESEEAPADFRSARQRQGDETHHAAGGLDGQPDDQPAADALQQAAAYQPHAGH